MRLILSFTLICVLLFTGCLKRNNTKYHFTGNIQVGTLSRTYIINLPPGYNDGNNYSLVIAMHGGGGSGEQFERSSLLSEKANSAGFIVVYPDGVQGNGVLKARTWNAGACCDYARDNNIDDVQFISRLIDKLVAEYKINPKKIYATGHSNGGMMSYRLACELSGKIAAIAPCGSTMVVTSPCIASRAVPVIHFHSEKDTNIPYQGGSGSGPGTVGLHLASLDSVMKLWSDKAACTNPNVVEVSNSRYTLTTWTGCNNNVSIKYYLTKDGGHSWPGGKAGSVIGDPPSTAINANDLLWEFFQQHSLP
mgnify:CR=1 FL=1